ncbi:MAG: YqzL family protein [Bacilli bacterium]
MKQLAWQTFVNSGSIDAYLLFKEMERSTGFSDEWDDRVEESEEPMA